MRICATNICSNFLEERKSRVSDISAEKEIISLDAHLSIEGVPALQLWDCGLETFSNFRR